MRGVLKDLFKNFKSPNQASSATTSQPVEFNEDYADFVNKEYERRQTERRSFEIQWRLNAEFLSGNQYLDINPVTLSLEEIPKLNWYSERECFNQIATIIETRTSKISKQKPAMKTRPATNDDVDVSASKVCSMILSSTWSDQEMDAAYEDFVSWLELQGTCFWKTTWNTRIGRVLFQGQGEDGSPIDIREGDIETAVVPAHEMYPDSSWRKGLKECRSIIHARAYHVDEIEEMWGIIVDAEDVDVITLQKSSSTMGGLGYTSGSFKTSAMKLKKHAVVKEYYELPTRKHPKGRFIVVAGEKTLHAGEMPYMIGIDGTPEYPFVRTVSIDRAGCFWGKTTLERCIPVQRRYNALRNRKAEYLNMVTIGQWKVPMGSVEEGTEINNAPGNIMYFRPSAGGGSPEPVQFPSLPSSFENEISTLLAEFTAISGISELSRYSEAPSGVKSGVALGISKEQDDTRISTSVSRIANSAVQLGKYWIRLYRQFVQEPRLLRYIGGNREVDVKEWTQSDLRSDDVFIENMSALAESISQRRQMVFDLLNAGLFNRPETSPLSVEGRQKVFNLLQFGHWETGADDDDHLHVSRARRENRRFMEGEAMPIMDFDDHQIHIEQHNRMRMQSEWEELLQTPIGPLADALMKQHIQQHLQIIAEMMMQQQAQVQEGQAPNETNKVNESN